MHDSAMPAPARAQHDKRSNRRGVEHIHIAQINVQHACSICGQIFHGRLEQWKCLDINSATNNQRLMLPTIFIFECQ